MPNPHRRSKNDHELLDSNMSPSDLIEVLEHLDFGERGRSHVTIKLDRGVRDYLVARIKPHVRF